MTLNADAPVFTPRKGVLAREYHVLVVWQDGRREKVGQFPRKPDAARWIKQKSAEWLAHGRHNVGRMRSIAHIFPKMVPEKVA